MPCLAPWSNFQCIRCPGPLTLKLGGWQWFSPHEKTYFVVLVLEVVFRGNHCREDTGTKYPVLASTVTPSPEYSSGDQLLFTSPWFHVLHNSKSLFYRLCCKTQRMEIQKELHICTIINTNAKEMKDWQWHWQMLKNTKNIAVRVSQRLFKRVWSRLFR